MSTMNLTAVAILDSNNTILSNINSSPIRIPIDGIVKFQLTFSDTIASMTPELVTITRPSRGLNNFNANGTGYGEINGNNYIFTYYYSASFGGNPNGFGDGGLGNFQITASEGIVENSSGVESEAVTITMPAFNNGPIYFNLQPLQSTIFTKNDNSINSLSITGALTSTDYPAGWTPSDIKKVDVGLGVTSIEGQGMFTGGAFSAADNLTTIIISYTVTSIGAGAFRISGGLTSALSSITFEIGSTLTTINGTAFQTTANLTTITIPSSVTTIGAGAFRFSGLTSITFESNFQPTTFSFTAFTGSALATVYMSSNTLSHLNSAFSLSLIFGFNSSFFGATNVTIFSTAPPPPPPPPIPPPISNRSGPIQYCTSRFARCNITKKTSFSSGNVTIQGTTNARRQSLIVNQSTYRHGAKLLFSNQVLNAYGRKAGGPGGFGASPRNQF